MGSAGSKSKKRTRKEDKSNKKPKDSSPEQSTSNSSQSSNTNKRRKTPPLSRKKNGGSILNSQSNTSQHSSTGDEEAVEDFSSTTTPPALKPSSSFKKSASSKQRGNDGGDSNNSKAKLDKKNSNKKSNKDTDNNNNSNKNHISSSSSTNNVSSKKKKKNAKNNIDKINSNNNLSTSGNNNNNSSSNAKKNKKSKRNSRPQMPEVDPKDMVENWEDNQTIIGGDQKRVTKDDFELLHTIGKGSFGKVLLVRKKGTDTIFAMKILRKEAIIQRKQVIHTKAEKNILQKIQHPFIVKLYYAFQTKEKLYMVMEYINGGELFFHLKQEGRFSEDKVRFYAAEIILALEHLHSFGIVYRDLKPENILLDENGHIVMTDFGLSKELKNEESTWTFCGTPEYLAPEVLKGKGHGKAVDWWSLGTLLYEMLTGLPPFYSQNIGVMYQKVLNSPLQFPHYLSQNCQSLLSGFLQRDVSKRLGNTAEDVHNHPWFKGIDWQQLEKKNVPAPFVPPVKSKYDISQIDPNFTAEPPKDSYYESNLSMSQLDFDGFSMVNTSALAEIESYDSD